MPVVKPREDVDGELVEVGLRYWRINGFDSETGRPVWAEKPRDIDCSAWDGRPFVVAAAGVRAVLPGYSCPSCQGELALVSHASLERITQDQAAGPCVECDANVQESVARMLAPQRLQRVRAGRERQAKIVQTKQQRQQWDEDRRAIVRAKYPLELQPDATVPDTSVRVSLLALAWLDHAPSSAPLTPVIEWVDPLHPDPDFSQDADCVAMVRRAGLVRPHPETALNSFVWEPPSFESALELVDDEGSPAPGQLTDSYYPLHTTFYTPYGPSLETAAERVRDELASRLDPVGMNVVERDELLEVVAEVLVFETLRYLHHLLEEYNLPEVPDNHRKRLMEAATAAAMVRPLGQLYNLAWQSARAAATSAQANPRAPKAHMTVHAVNRFESLAQQALNPDRQFKLFGQAHDLELAALTRTVFLRVLHRDPFATGLDSISADFPSASSRGQSSGQDEKLVGSRDSDFGELRCSECGLPVQSQNAWLWVDVQAAMAHQRYWKEQGDKTPHGGIEHPRAHWTVGHTECVPEEIAIRDIRLPGNYQEMLVWVADLLPKTWLAGTDLEHFLREAAKRVGRFA